MISNDIERKVVVTAPRTMRAAQITAFSRPMAWASRVRELNSSTAS